MPLLTELIVFLRYRYYKDWAPTEWVLASAESSPQANHVFHQSAFLTVQIELGNALLTIAFESSRVVSGFCCQRSRRIREQSASV
jgi:hypothetical protein